MSTPDPQDAKARLPLAGNREASVSLTFVGRLVLPSGKENASLEGAEIHFLKIEGDGSEPNLRPEKAVAITATMGSFHCTIEEADYAAFASLRGCRTRVQIEPARISITKKSGSPQDLIWPVPLGVLRGKVKDCNGVPLAGIQLRAGTAKTKSDESGNYELAYLDPKRRIAIAVDEASLPEQISPPWWQTLSAGEITGDAHQGTPTTPLDLNTMHEIVLELRTNVVGKVLLFDGLPLRMGTISMRARFGPKASIMGPNYVVQTDEEGRFTIENPARGGYEARLFSSPPSQFRPDPLEIFLDCGQSIDPLLLLFDKGLGKSKIQGQVKDIQGRPLANLYFGLWPKKGAGGPDFSSYARGICYSSDHGEFWIEGIPQGEYLLARTPSHNPFSEKVVLDKVPWMEVKVDRGGGTTIVEWISELAIPAQLEGRIENFAELREKKITWKAWVEIQRPGFNRMELPIVCSADGHFVMQNLPAGPAKILVSSTRDSDRSVEIPLTLSPGKNAAVPILVKP